MLHTDGYRDFPLNRGSVRLFALGRENWLFSNTSKGADASATYAAVKRRQHGFPLGEQIHQGKFWTGLSEDVPQPRTERELPRRRDPLLTL